MANLTGYFSSSRGVSGAPITSADASAGVDITDAIPSDQFAVLDDLVISTKVAMDVTIKEESTSAIIDGPYYMPATGSIQVTLSGKCKAKTVGKKLRVFSSTSGSITVTPMWHVEK